MSLANVDVKAAPAVLVCAYARIVLVLADKGYRALATLGKLLCRTKTAVDVEISQRPEESKVL